MRALFLLVALLSVAACHVPAEHTGNRPMGPRRMRDYDQSSTIEQRMEARDKMAADAEKARAREVSEDELVIGTHATSVYHLDSCDLLDEVGTKERVRFVSPYDALDGGYRPCPRCRPGP